MDAIKAFLTRGVVVKAIINGMTFDGSTKDLMLVAVRDALIAFMAATAQAQAEGAKEAQKAGIAYAKAKEDAYRGRKPSFIRQQVHTVRDLLAKDTRIAEVARISGLTELTW